MSSTVYICKVKINQLMAQSLSSMDLVLHTAVFNMTIGVVLRVSV
jgi:hypothetical protein